MIAPAVVPGLAEQVEAWARIGAAEGRVESVRPACDAVVADLESRAVPDDVVLVVRGLDPMRVLRRLHLPGSTRRGILDRNHGPEGLVGYAPIAGLEIPDTAAYALVGVQRGDEYRDLPPRDALADVGRRGRTPLTIEEGLALVLVAPGALRPNHCFSLAGSRRGDRRVPALWISAGAPKLGWCWEGAPHAWLGLASAAARVP